MFFSIYLPVWADSFGTEIEKPQWFALLLIANPLGTVFGYGVGAASQENYGWRAAFYF